MIAMAMCNVCPAHEIENLIHVILNIFDARKTLLRLLKALIDREVAQTSKRSIHIACGSTLTLGLSQ
jgi:hypothetical protein